MLDPSTFSPPIAQGQEGRSPSQIVRRLTKAADTVLAPLYQRQVLFTESPQKGPIGHYGTVVQAATLDINTFNARLAQRDAALTTLSKRPVTETVPAVTEQVIVGYTGLEDPQPIYEDREISAEIPGEPLTITVPTFNEETGELTGEQEIDNPVVVKDNEKRAAAQQILDNLPQEVLDWGNEE